MQRICLLMWVATAVAQNYNLDTRSVQFAGKANNLGPLYTPGLGVANAGYRDDSYEENVVTPTPAPTPLQYRPQQQAVYRKPTSEGAVRVISGPRGNQVRGGQYVTNSAIEPEQPLEEEKEEPDRLSLLLPNSKFDCVGKQTGYYADEDLNCEVFHYCQDNAKHSWICPEGFSFHQVHLICMPPNGDGNCKKSSQYHFVNEYLYKPLNLQEAESKPNVTLRYSERYFPEEVFTDERDNEYENVSPFRRPVNQHQQQQQHHQHQSELYQPTQQLNSIQSHPNRPSQIQQNHPSFRLPINQVFRSPEEVNIPLQQRRPQQQNILRRFPQVRPNEEDYE